MYYVAVASSRFVCVYVCVCVCVCVCVDVCVCWVRLEHVYDRTHDIILCMTELMHVVAGPIQPKD